MDYAKELSNLEVDVNARLTADVKKSLTAIIEQEFSNKDSLFRKMQQQEKDAVLKKYRKSVEFDKLIRKINSARSVLAEAQKALEDVGLDEGGEARSSSRYYNGGYQTDYKAKKLNDLLSAVEQNAPSESIKSKLIARLQMATKMGEANAIMLQVLGNNIIPSLDIKAITHSS